MNRLTIVSGKGGVGKTTVATALALASAARGVKTLLVSLEGTDEKHPVFGLAFGYEPVPVPNVDGPLELLRLEAVPAVREYVRRRLPLGRLYDGAFESRAFKDFASATPGFEELMVLGKLYDLITTGAAEEIVFDAPASGHLRQLLKVPAATRAAVRFGPMYDIACKIEGRLQDPATTRVVLPVLPEEMPLRESLELARFVREELGLESTLLLNRVQEPTLSATELAELVEVKDAQGEGATAAWLERCRRVMESSMSETAALDEVAESLAAGESLADLLRLPQVTPKAERPVSGPAEAWAFGCNRQVAEALLPLLAPISAGATR